uniref:THAP-type domain-containing protein n=1 Tax=Anguilla anguilla TaxID=7936 RepID=A0A0E9V9D6_ANGAN
MLLWHIVVYHAVTSYQRRECDQGLSFHQFPSNLDTRRQWIAKIRRDVGPYFQVM